MDAVVESIDDASINAMIKTTLLYHRSTSALKTTVETKEGGKAEKNLATKHTSYVHGVKSMINNMTIERTKSKTK